MRSPNFAACGRAEQKKSRNFTLRAALESIPLSFRTVSKKFAPRDNAQKSESFEKSL